MEKLGKLFGIEGILINRYPDRPWMRQADSYGNENIRPGEKSTKENNRTRGNQRQTTLVMRS